MLINRTIQMCVLYALNDTLIYGLNWAFLPKFWAFSLSENAFFFFFFFFCWVIVYCGGIEPRVNGYKMNRVPLGYKAWW